MWFVFARGAVPGVFSVAAVVIIAMPGPTAVATTHPLSGAPPATVTTSTPTTPPPERTQTDAAPGPLGEKLLPDLIALPAMSPIVAVGTDGRWLRFTSALGNIGAGPIEVRPNRNRPCPAGEHNAAQIIYHDGNKNGSYQVSEDTDISRHRAGCMVFHPSHNHWHFRASARYMLLKAGTPDRVVVSVKRKVSFCLRDTARVPTRYGTWHQGETYAYCTAHNPQGISVGWMDIYQSYLPGQNLRLPKRLKDGLYCLETVVDPIDQVVESDNDNNSSIRALSIRGDHVIPAKTKRCR